MRMIGSIQDEAAASNFRDYLLVQGIENQLEKDADGRWCVWVHSDDELERASGYLADFTKNPEDSRFHVARAQLDEIRSRQQASQEAFEKRFHDRQQVFRPFFAYGIGPLTMVLIALCVVVFLYTDFGDRKTTATSASWLFISNPLSFQALQSIYGSPWDRFMALKEVRGGEIWRLITPIFLHFGPIHILFNMLWIKDLGSMIEARLSSLYLAAMVIIIAILSNTAQMIISGPYFGGMSGVVYGLFGYIWIRGKFDPFCGLFLHKTIVTMMLIWFFACYLVIPHVANTVHGVGLLIGMVWGFIDAKR
jgi:GlpG protein